MYYINTGERINRGKLWQKLIFLHPMHIFRMLIIKQTDINFIIAQRRVSRKSLFSSPISPKPRQSKRINKASVNRENVGNCRPIVRGYFAG